MGMYDTVICKYPLPMPSDPKGYAGSEDFQTKHLDCGLDTYEIAANGQLSVYKREGNYIEPDKEAKGLFEKIGRFEVTRTWLEPVYDTLTMEMYDYKESSESGYDYFVQYKVIFIDGIVDEIKLTEFEASRKADEALARFNARMESVDQSYDLDDEDRQLLVQELKELNETEEAFASFQNKLSIMWKHKNKEAKTAIDDNIINIIGFKLYPNGATTNSHNGVTNIKNI